MIEKMVEFLHFFEEEQTEEKYRDYLKNVKVMTGAGVINVLNKSCSFIEKNNCYLEVGAHRGSTLIGASLNNLDTFFYGVDDFSGHNSEQDCSPFRTVEEGLKDAIERLGHDKVKYFAQSCSDFFKDRKDINEQKVQIYFYDGDHQRHSTYFGVKAALPLLANEAIVFLDDSANNDREAVWGAVNDLIEDDYGLELIKEWIPKKMHGDMWCGLIALKYSRKE